MLLCNPPYGERIGEEKDLRGLYRSIGEVLAERWQGWQAYVFTGKAGLTIMTFGESTRPETGTMSRKMLYGSES